MSIPHHLPAGMTALHKAAMENDVAYLDEHSITEPELLNVFLGNTPLLWGVASSSEDFVLRFLESFDSTHINMKSKCVLFLNTPLILSMAKGWAHTATERVDSQPQALIAQKLLEKRAAVDATDKHRRTALHYACLHRNEDAINALLNANADLSAQDENGHTPLDYCCFNEEIASNILAAATGGRRGYTFTLQAEHFEENFSAVFYAKMASLQNIDLPVDSFHRMERFHTQINHALAGFNGYVKEISESDAVLFNGSTIHFQALTEVQQRLKKAVACSIFSEHNELFFENKKREVGQVISDALANPIIKTERRMIREASLAVLNVLSIICVGLPLLAHYHYSGQFFFSVQRSIAEQLLNEISEKSENIFTTS